MTHFSDEFLAYLELKQDMFFNKIPNEKLAYYIEQALTIGRDYADSYAGKTIEQLYEQAGITIRTENHDGEFFKVKLRAQFETNSKGNSQVYLYKESILPLAEANQMEYEEMAQIILTHEFFHNIEYGLEKTIGDQLEPVETLRVFGLSRKANITRASEVAANAFTKRFLDLSYLPNYYDYQFLLATKQMTPKDLEEEHAEFLTAVDR